MGTLKLHSNVQLFNTTVISTLAIDGCTVTFGTVRRPGSCGPNQYPPSRTKCNSPPINSQSSSSSRMCVMNHNWSVTKQRFHPHSVAKISRLSVLSEDRIQQCGTSSGSCYKDTVYQLHIIQCGTVTASAL